MRNNTRTVGVTLRNEPRKISATSDSSVSLNMCKWLQAKANVSPFLSQTRSADQPGNRKYELNDTRISLIEASANTNISIRICTYQTYIRTRLRIYEDVHICIHVFRCSLPVADALCMGWDRVLGMQVHNNKACRLAVSKAPMNRTFGASSQVMHVKFSRRRCEMRLTNFRWLKGCDIKRVASERGGESTVN